MLRPEQPVPLLAFNLVDGGEWSLAGHAFRSLLMIVIFRGGFCRFCRRFLGDLAAMSGAFAERGVDIVAASSDNLEEARGMSATTRLDGITLGYGLEPPLLRDHGVFVSEALRGGVPRRFAEPSLWLVRPDRRLFAIFQGSLSCARPDLASLIEGIDLLAPAGFPPRGHL